MLVARATSHGNSNLDGEIRRETGALARIASRVRYESAAGNDRVDRVMCVTKNPDISLNDQVMPLVEVRRTEMTFMTIAGNILDGAMMSDHRSYRRSPSPSLSPGTPE